MNACENKNSKTGNQNKKMCRYKKRDCLTQCRGRGGLLAANRHFHSHTLDLKIKNRRIVIDKCNDYSFHAI